MAADLNLFKEEICWKGELGGKVRPLKAMVIWVMAMHPPPHPCTTPPSNYGLPQFGCLRWAGTAKQEVCPDGRTR